MTTPAAHSLMPLVYEPDRLKRAARTLMRRAGAPGPDGMTWSAYRTGLNTRIAELSERLRGATWAPGPVRLVGWPAWGKHLTIAITGVEDRIVHRALRLAAEPVLEQRAYPDWMFGWRPQAGRVEAISAAATRLSNGKTWVADVDVAAATTGATTNQAIDWLARWVHDGTYLHTVRLILDALPHPLAPGSGLTPMLTNLRLAAVDDQLTVPAVPGVTGESGLSLVRLTDNYTAFCPSRHDACGAMERITAALAAQGLAPNWVKSKVWQPNPEDLYLAG
jgi:hypothetical protein